MLDIGMVIETQDKLDTERIRFWVKQFADLLEMPELLTELENLLQKKK
jgi:hypothetical protein